MLVLIPKHPQFRHRTEGKGMKTVIATVVTIRHPVDATRATTISVDRLTRDGEEGEGVEVGVGVGVEVKHLLQG